MRARYQALRNDMLQRFPQAQPVVLAGQRIMIGKKADFFFGFLARVDVPDHAGQAHGLSGVAMGGHGALLNPDELTCVVADPVFMIEHFRAFEIPLVEKVSRCDEQADEIGQRVAVRSVRRDAWSDHLGQF